MSKRKQTKSNTQSNIAVKDRFVSKTVLLAKHSLWFRALNALNIYHLRKRRMPLKF